MDFNKICPHCMHQISDAGICSYCKKNPRELAEVSHQLRPFTILQGKYLVGDILGEGGFGITYIGLDINLEIPVAIKEFYPNGFVTRESAVTTTLTVYSSVDTSVVEKWKDNFLGEARCLARCANLPGVVGVKDFFHENNTVYIVQEYLEGETLKSYIKSKGGRIPADEVIKSMQPVINALNEVHKQGLIHRDISPDNIMLLKNGTMKVLDFGAARSFAEENEKSKSVLLKPGYAPEEQYRTRGKQGPWTDVYALCATMYKCITGVTPLESMERLRHDEMKWPTEMGVSVPMNFENILKKGMAVIAENRIQNMQELYDAIYNGTVLSENTGAITGSMTSAMTGAVPPPITSAMTGVVNGQRTSAMTGAVTGPMTSAMTGAVHPPMTSAMTGASTGPMTGGNNTGNSKITKPALMIAVGSFLCICLIAVAVIAGGMGNKSKKALQVTTTTETTTTENKKVEETAKKASEADVQRMQELKTIAQEMEDITIAGDLLDEVDEIFKANEGSEEIQSLAKEIYAAYYGKTTAYIDMIKGIENFNIDHYRECAIRYDEMEHWNAELNCGYESQLADSKEVCKKEYKNKYVKRFDDECMKTLGENGVISRTVAWDVLKGIENTDLYHADSAGDENYRYDSLRLRYIVAKIYKIHKDIDAGIDVDTLINTVKDAMVECDYDPMLVYLLAINGYEPAEAWIEEIEFIISSYGNFEGYTYANDSDRLNFVYIYNTNPQEYRECKDRVITYMQDYYY
ncbi:MAG: protein kinase [Lachnospiraceae bacterium]|nr:protein kinase [Lachnospiraceae bacterium]